MGSASGTVYVGAGTGAFIGGVLPGILRPYTGSAEKARRIVMGTAALCVIPMMFVFFTSSLPLGLILLTTALMAHQVFSSNLFGLVTDWLPAGLVGRVIGIGAFVATLEAPLFCGLVDLCPCLICWAVAAWLTWPPGVYCWSE